MRNSFAPKEQEPIDTNPGMTTRLARFAAHHAWYAIAVWLLALVAAFVLSGNLDISK
jgi:hypothetical protein